jgi:hypothetical protein
VLVNARAAQTHRCMGITVIDVTSCSFVAIHCSLNKRIDLPVAISIFIEDGGFLDQLSEYDLFQ